jgi:hypothetical protein
MEERMVRFGAIVIQAEIKPAKVVSLSSAN